MPTFPRLKTDAIAQYPVVRGLRFQNRVIGFLDGTEQRYRDWAGALRRWVIRLELLDEVELAGLRQFVSDQQGAFGSFEFVDPWDESSYPDCSFEQDGFDMELAGEMRGAAELAIRQNRT